MPVQTYVVARSEDRRHWMIWFHGKPLTPDRFATQREAITVARLLAGPYRNTVVVRPRSARQ